jgi:hypothetical protein
MIQINEIFFPILPEGLQNHKENYSEKCLKENSQKFTQRRA